MPQYVAPSFSLAVPAREPSRSGEPCHPSPWPSVPDATPLVLRVPGSPSAIECRPSEASASPLAPFLPGAASRYSRFAAPESALHRRRINTGRHPNSLEVNASFPRAPTTSTSYLPYPATSLQKPDEGSRMWGDDFHVGRDRRRLDCTNGGTTCRTMTNIEYAGRSSVGPAKRSRFQKPDERNARLRTKRTSR